MSGSPISEPEFYSVVLTRNINVELKVLEVHKAST